MPKRQLDDVLGAIDVGTNAIRLELARVLPDGSLEPVHSERDPVRPGEGLFTTGVMQKEVVDRLIVTLRRYGALCRRYNARVRAVATSAVREARNRDEVVKRVRREAQVALEVISGREEARLISLGVLHGKPPKQKAICIDVGGGSTEIIIAEGSTPKHLWSVDAGAVRVTELFNVRGEVPKKQLKIMREFAADALKEAIPKPPPGLPNNALGSSGTVGAVVAFARSEGVGHATLEDIEDAVEQLAAMDREKRRRRFDPRRADVVLAGAVVLEAAMKQLHLKTITAVDRGLREGVLLDLLKRRKADHDDPSLADAAVDIGRRLGFTENHARQVTRLALTLFDDLASLHSLPASARPLLETAALLHDVGYAVNHQRHHKHTYYLIQNVDLPGLTDRERLMVATIARFHRRSKPDAKHELLKDFPLSELRLVRKCSALLRIADSLDRSHLQPVNEISANVRGAHVVVKVKAKQSVDLELWDVEHEAELFREVFGKSIHIAVGR